VLFVNLPKEDKYDFNYLKSAIEQYAAENVKAVNPKFAVFLIASQAKKAFSRLIVQKDKALKYHTEKFVTEKDPEAVKAELVKYQKEKNEMDRIVAEWKTRNADLFTEVKYIPSVSKYASRFSVDEDVYDVEDAVQGYKASSALLNEVKKEKEALQVATKKVILPQYEDQYKEFLKEAQEATGFPGRQAVEESVKSVVQVVKTRLKLDRKPCIELAPFFKYVEDCVGVLKEFDEVQVTSDSDENDEDEE